MTPEGRIASDVHAIVEATRDVLTSPLRAALPGLIADMAADAELNARVMSRYTGLFDAVRARLASPWSGEKCMPARTRIG